MTDTPPQKPDTPTVEHPANNMGITRYVLDGKLHREDGPAKICARCEIRNEDGTLRRVFGSKRWFKHGQPHRAGGPAFEFETGTQKWYVDGKLHREDGPAVTTRDGVSEWWLHGRLHREGAPAIIHAYGTQPDERARLWFRHGKLHREGGPAVEIGPVSKADIKQAIDAAQKSGHAFDEAAYRLNCGYYRPLPKIIPRHYLQLHHGDMEWWVNGKRHREDGPAVERLDGTKKWFRCGRLLREDAPPPLSSAPHRPNSARRDNSYIPQSLFRIGNMWTAVIAFALFFIPVNAALHPMCYDSVFRPWRFMAVLLLPLLLWPGVNMAVITRIRRTKKMLRKQAGSVGAALRLREKQDALLWYVAAAYNALLVALLAFAATTLPPLS